MAKSHWKLWTDAASERAARVVGSRVLERLGDSRPHLEVEAYPKGGHVIRFSLEHTEPTWPEVVVALLRLSQRVGQGWEIAYHDHDEIDFWGAKAAGLTHFNVAGVTAIEIRAQPSPPWDRTTRGPSRSV